MGPSLSDQVAGEVAGNVPGPAAVGQESVGVACGECGSQGVPGYRPMVGDPLDRGRGPRRGRTRAGGGS